MVHNLLFRIIISTANELLITFMFVWTTVENKCLFGNNKSSASVVGFILIDLSSDLEVSTCTFIPRVDGWEGVWGDI